MKHGKENGNCHFRTASHCFKAQGKIKVIKGTRKHLIKPKQLNM